jgi:signal transduction histidine kinase
VLATFFAAAALKTIVGRLVDNPSAFQLRRILADALDDPSLELAFAVDRAGLFVASSGSPVSPTLAAGRASTPVVRNGETVALIVHDEALETDPELVATAGQALLLAIENGRLTDELESTSAELRVSRARVVAAGDAERRKIERDLHDGAQQHLVALRIKVGLARELAADDPEAASRLADLGSELEEILQELRDLARGLDPPLLRQFGLREALAGVSRRTTPPVRFEATAIRRYSENVESAVYFCCLEALQNVGKHAGVDARAAISLWERGGQLSFEVRDEGAGYDLERARSSGQGLANMSDRIAALGGTLVVESALGRGTSVQGSVPVPT